MSDPITEIAAPLAAAGKELVDRLTPDVNARAGAIMGAQREALDAEIAAGTAQSDVDKIEAANPSKFIGGWRPALGWLGVICLGLYYIPTFVIGEFMWFMTFVHSCRSAAGCVMPPKPDLGVAEILGLVTTLLGGGALRTLDKFLRVDTKSLGQGAGGIRTIVARVGAGARAAARLIPLVLAAGLALAAAACAVPPASILPQDQPGAAALPVQTIPFACATRDGRRMELTIDVAGDATALAAYLARPSAATAAAFLNWTLANEPDAIGTARQVVDLIEDNCS